MKQDGQFILMNIVEFNEWLNKQNIKRNIYKIQLHHTEIPNYSQWFKNPDEFYFQKSMQRFHMETQTWRNIAQHFTIFPNGMICTGRDLEMNPAGIYNHNTGSICIENLGNFDKEKMFLKQKRAIVEVVASLCLKFGIPVSTNNILYHSWFNLNTGIRDNDDGDKSDNISYKTCPAKYFFGGYSTYTAEKYLFPLISKKINKINQIK